MAAHHINLLSRQSPHLLPGQALEQWDSLPQDLCSLSAADVSGCGRIDVVLASWPCPGLSAANRSGQGLADARSGLFFEALRVLRLAREGNPAVRHMFENVAFHEDHPSGLGRGVQLPGPTPGL